MLGRFRSNSEDDERYERRTSDRLRTLGLAASPLDDADAGAVRERLARLGFGARRR
jgi:hypothetical protein